MDTILIISGALLILLGIAGSVLPVLPGPPLGYAGLLLLHFTSEPHFTIRFLVAWGLVTAAITVLDYVIPVFGTKYFGGTSRGMWGAAVGLVIGIFFLPPAGMIIGPFFGALIGEMTGGAKSGPAFKAAFGSFIGFLAGTFMKLALSVTFAVLFVLALF